jgi:putative SOS response-associated peptidase YedK
MGRRYSASRDRERLEARFQAKFDELLFQPRYNAAPSQALPVILNTEPQTIQRLAWGLRPAWSRTIGKKDGIINVRAETLREHPTFKGDLAERRCLVLADSFYAWRKEAGKRKTPFRILLKTAEPFAFAGLWEENEDTDGHRIRTFALITTAANALVAQVHPRMPVLLQREDERVWLEQGTKPEKALAVLRPYPAELMQLYEVSPRVNRATEDQPGLIAPHRRSKRRAPAL